MNAILHDPTILAYALRIALVLAAAIGIALFARLRPPPAPRTPLARVEPPGQERRRSRFIAWAVLPVLLLALYALARATTPQIAFGEGKSGMGYGHDGVFYGAITEWFVPFQLQVPPPFCYRVLPALLVRASGLETFAGFHLVNFLCYVAAGFVAFRLLRRCGADAPSALLGVMLFSCLKFGLKFWLYYPVLTDGLGTLLLVTLLYSIQAQRHLLYALCLVMAVFSRENLLICAGAHAIRTLSLDRRPSRWALVAAASGVPVLVYIVSRAVPLVQPLGAYDPLIQMLTFFRKFLADPHRWIAWPLAMINALGVLALVPLFAPRATAAFLWTQPHWAFYLAASLALTITGGGDTDRFAYWLAPALLPLVAVYSGPADPALRLRRLAGLALLQLAWSEVLVPWSEAEAFYLSRYAAYAPPPAFLALGISCAVLAAAMLFIETTAEYRTRNSES